MGKKKQEVVSSLIKAQEQKLALPAVESTPSQLSQDPEKEMIKEAARQMLEHKNSSCHKKLVDSPAGTTSMLVTDDGSPCMEEEAEKITTSRRNDLTVLPKMERAPRTAGNKADTC